MEQTNFDAMAKAFAHYRAGAITDVVLGFETVAQQLRPLDGKYVLDYGCGAGNFSRFLRNQGARVTGIDASHEMIALAQSNDAHGIRYRVIAPGAPIDDVRDGAMDAVTMNFLLSTMATKEAIAHVFHEAWRVLRPGGLLVILGVNWERANGVEFLTFALDYFPQLVSGMKVGGTLKGEMPFHVDDYYWSSQDCRMLLQEAGFTLRASIEPLAFEDGHAWIHETTIPPFLVHVARKNA